MIEIKIMKKYVIKVWKLKELGLNPHLENLHIKLYIKISLKSHPVQPLFHTLLIWSPCFCYYP
jgi:hypothetical protein